MGAIRDDCDLHEIPAENSFVGTCFEMIQEVLSIRYEQDSAFQDWGSIDQMSGEGDLGNIYPD